MESVHVTDSPLAFTPHPLSDSPLHSPRPAGSEARQGLPALRLPLDEDEESLGLSRLRAAARAGRWAEAAADVQLQLRDAALSRDDLLPRLAYQALAAAKLRQWRGCGEALRAAAPLLGDACAAARAPASPAFALLLLAAQLSEKLGAGGASDALCLLLEACRQAEAAATAEGLAEEAARARARAARAHAALLAHHASRREWRAALSWLEWGARLGVAGCGGASARSAAAALLLQLGDASAAAAAAPAGAGWAARADGAALLLASGQPAAAREAWEAAAAAAPRGPARAAACSNAAAAALYAGELGGAVGGLEAALAADPRGALDERLVANLCSLFDLSVAEPAGAKAAFADWAAALAGDDFDISMLRPK